MGYAPNISPEWCDFSFITLLLLKSFYTGSKKRHIICSYGLRWYTFLENQTHVIYSQYITRVMWFFLYIAIWTFIPSTLSFLLVCTDLYSLAVFLSEWYIQLSCITSVDFSLTQGGQVLRLICICCGIYVNSLPTQICLLSTWQHN